MDAANPWVLFVKSFLSQAGGYFAVVGLVFLLVWKWGERRFQAARIQPRKRFNGKQLRHELTHTVATLALGTLSAGAVALLYQAGLTKLSADRAAWSWPSIILNFVGLLVFSDAWFYAWHRFLHRPAMMRWVHSVHHRSVDVNPFSSYSFHVVEAFLLGAWVIPAVMLVPIYLPVFGVLQVLGLANNVMAHLGYEFLPRWYARIPPFRWLTTSTYHNLHHTRFHGNYGLLFRWWDRWLGTELPEYERVFAERGTEASAPASIATGAGLDAR
jgi:sterol desaturase/sphingolipid hydroxylase (fatty acid hydroxylase superfamily)